MSATKVFVVDGQHFSAAVAQAGAVRAPDQAGSPRTIDDPALDALSMILSTLKGDDAERCAGLIAKRVALNSQCATFLRQCQAKALADMESAHESLKEQCQEQLEQIGSFKNRLAELQKELNKIETAKGVALACLQSARADLAGLSRFTPKGKIQKAEGSVRDANEKVEALVPWERDVRTEWQRIELNELPLAHARMRELESQESQARAMLNGESYTDELGIVHEGRTVKRAQL